MKSIISCLLSLTILFCMSAFVFADDFSTEFNWADAEYVFKEELADESYLWHIEEVDAGMWLPSGLLPAELTDEDRANDIIDVFVSPNGTNFILLTYSDLEGVTLDMLYTVFQQEGKNVEKVSVNSIPAVLMKDTDGDSLLLMFRTQEGKLFQCIFAPLADEELYKLIIDSIQPYVEEAEDNAEPVVSVNPVRGLISK